MHEQCKSLIRAYADGVITPGQLEELEQALQADSSVREQFLHEINVLAALEDVALGEMAPTAGDDESERRDSVAETAAAPGRRNVIWWPRGVLAAASAAVLVVAILLARGDSGSMIATITELNGSVQLIADGGQVNRDLEAGRRVPGGTVESLSAESWCTLEFDDGSTVTISGKAALTVSDRERKQLHLREGRLSATVAPQPEGCPLLLHTPTAQLEVLGTRLDVLARPEMTTLTVSEGRVRATRLADGRVAEVPADHQIVVSANPRLDFSVARRSMAVSTWRSDLPKDATEGKWLPEMGGRVMGLRAFPLLRKSANEQPQVVFLAGGSVAREPPVVLQSGGALRIRGKIDTAPDLIIGITVQHPTGGFSGKYVVTRPAGSFHKVPGFFDLEVPVEEMAAKDGRSPDTPVGLEMCDWWCATVTRDAGLSILSVELVSGDQRQVQNKPEIGE